MYVNSKQNRKIVVLFSIDSVAKTYDQFQIKLQFEELENQHDAMDSDGSFMEWKRSSRDNCWNRTPQRPSVAQKRKKPDELDVSNRTFSVKRRRIDGQNVIEMESEIDENVEEQAVDDSTYPQIERDDEIPEAVETTKEAEKINVELLVSMQTASVEINATPGNASLFYLKNLLHVKCFCVCISKEKKQSKACSFLST